MLPQYEFQMTLIAPYKGLDARIFRQVAKDLRCRIKFMDLAFDEAIEAATSAYKKLLDAGVPAEDARYLLPNAAESKIVVTMNVRELLHFFSLRCCNRAQWEIRELAHRMLELARPTAPFVFAAAGAPCVRGACPEGKMTCGNPYPKAVRE